MTENPDLRCAVASLLLESEPLPALLIPARGEVRPPNPAMQQLIDQVAPLAALLPANHAPLVAACQRQQRCIEDVEVSVGDRYLLWTYIPQPALQAVLVRGRDASESLRLQHEAMRASRLYRLIIENTTDLISRHTPDGRFLDASPAAWTLLGYWPEQLRGESMAELLHPQEREQLIERFQRALEQDGYLTLTYRIRHQVGHYLWFETASRAIRETYTGGVVEVISVSRDITARIQSEENNRRLQDELAHAARLATLGELASGIAHELNQPLAAILNYANASQRYLAALSQTEEGRNGEESDKVAQGLARIAEHAQHAAEVIRRLRGFLRKGQRRQQCVDPLQLAREAVGLCAWEAGQHQVEIVEQVDGPLPAVMVDPILLQQVLLNLLRNAIEANREQHPDTPSLVRLGLSEHGNRLHIRVSDQGPGVDEASRARLFTPFYTSKPDGLGLGLSMSQGIVEGFGGGLEAVPADSAGLCLHCWLPVVSSD
ncbi:sensor histidine kinase [Halopseudomonas salina]|uniref:histidine kinase n=1 Tax=Halopseudomonas salina TaxID=1323744 RepID=A0ABQ1PZP1_9GAMM|nr:PAS domain-containing sensor histidine kinase [Halopseudomonas salina]GGD07524.1 hypothetical protein GCM10007418_28190 [Halopseudomonas salina]